jgi:hypothetical protein
MKRPPEFATLIPKGWHMTSDRLGLTDTRQGQAVNPRRKADNMTTIDQPTPAEKLTRLDEAYKRHLAEAAEVVQELTAMGEEAGVAPGDNLPLNLATEHLRQARSHGRARPQ